MTFTKEVILAICTSSAGTGLIIKVIEWAIDRFGKRGQEVKEFQANIKKRRRA